MGAILTELTWDKVRKQVLKLNPELAAIIDDISPDSSYTFIKATYPYGSEILKDSLLHLPEPNSGLRPFNSEQLNSTIKSKLAYCMGSNPVALVLKNNVELFIELQDRVIPFGIVNPGRVFGTWRFLDPDISYCPKTFMWGMTAGARSIFMLPKISQAVGHNKILNKYHLAVDKPRNLLEHWHVFRAISNTKEFGEEWETSVLYFTGKWFEKKHDKRWANFFYYLLNNAWQGSGYWRNQFIWELVFSMIEKNRNIKPPPYLTKQVKHLLAMATGAIMGFTPAIDDHVAPIKKLQQIYVEDYGLTEYMPIIMQPATFSLYEQDCNPIYYSLQLPTAMEFSLKASERTTTLTDLHLLQSLLRKYIHEIASGRLNVEKTPLYDAATKAEYSFLHSTTGDYRDIINTSGIILEDKSFSESCGQYNKATFPHKANFLNGCVRISHKKQ